jgi:hypothetical protein
MLLSRVRQTQNFPAAQVRSLINPPTGRPCKIVDMSTSKTGKHGHAKVHLVAIDVRFFPFYLSRYIHPERLQSDLHQQKIG